MQIERKKIERKDREIKEKKIQIGSHYRCVDTYCVAAPQKRKTKRFFFSFYALFGNSSARVWNNDAENKSECIPIDPLLSMDLPTFWLIYNTVNKSQTNKTLKCWSLHLAHSSSKKIHRRAFHVFERLHSNGNGIFCSALFSAVVADSYVIKSWVCNQEEFILAHIFPSLPSKSHSMCLCVEIIGDTFKWKR